VKLDVKGAYIQTEMQGAAVFMRCNRWLTEWMVKTLPGLSKYVTKDGIMYCKLLKALYGYVQASKFGSRS
jgi:hypothetical protein